MSVADEVRKLTELRDQGILSEQEYAQAKARALGNAAPESAPAAASVPLGHFRRALHDRWLGGVCGGLAVLTGMESWLWRLLFVFSFCFAGVGFIPYVLLWIFVPNADS